MIVVGQFTTAEEAKEMEYIRKIILVGSRARLLAGEKQEE